MKTIRAKFIIQSIVAVAAGLSEIVMRPVRNNEEVAMTKDPHSWDATPGGDIRLRAAVDPEYASQMQEKEPYIAVFIPESEYAGQVPSALPGAAVVDEPVPLAPPVSNEHVAEGAEQFSTDPVRLITDHIVNPTNDKLQIAVLDGPGAGGASHHYMVTTPDWQRNPDGSGAKGVWDIEFQNGGIAENGVNGLTQEVLLAIVADRLKSFQAGPFACEENAEALDHVEKALSVLKLRTEARMARGVEGKQEA